MRIFFVCFLSFFFVSCSLPGVQSESTSTDTVSYSASGFSMQLPKTWTPVATKDTPTPYHGTIALAYISPDVSYGFSNNILVMRDDINYPITSVKYSELNQLQTTKNYLEYTKLQDDPLLFSDSDESRVYVFEARYNASTPLMKFIQTAKVCGTHVFLLHAGLALDKDPTSYIELFRSFKCS